ncbi:MAG: hypothetical protein IKA02_05455 [Clostridia bacterium]|nr:hypothetical protein [Clostridia bacterium]
MSLYLIKLTPWEPYFFGNEKSFKYPGTKIGGSNQYFIKSELLPAQTSILGLLRYILLPVKKDFKEYTNEDKKINAETVGEFSFKYGNKNDFKKIHGISSVFLMKDGELLIPTPFDHNNEFETYTPFSNYASIDSDRIYPTEYNSKIGICNSFMSLSTKKIYDYCDIFEFDTRIGINRSSKNDGFFKKTYVTLKKGFSICVYGDFDDSVSLEKSIAYMGQGKSLFTVDFDKVDNDAISNFYSMVASCLNGNVVYCLSDIFMDSSIYEDTRFAITKTKDYRAYTTDGGKVTKHSSLYKLISAGSIFIPKINKEDFCKKFNDETVTVIGYNTVIKKED